MQNTKNLTEAIKGAKNNSGKMLAFYVYAFIRVGS